MFLMTAAMYGKTKSFFRLTKKVILQELRVYLPIILPRTVSSGATLFMIGTSLKSQATAGGKKESITH